jgi:hypothetical protein
MIYYEKHLIDGKMYIHAWVKTVYGVDMLLWIRKFNEAA